MSGPLLLLEWCLLPFLESGVVVREMSKRPRTIDDIYNNLIFILSVPGGSMDNSHSSSATRSGTIYGTNASILSSLLVWSFLPGISHSANQLPPFTPLRMHIDGAASYLRLQLFCSAKYYSKLTSRRLLLTAQQITSPMIGIMNDTIRIITIT